jgi:hypothetical protein
LEALRSAALSLKADAPGAALLCRRGARVLSLALRTPKDKETVGGPQRRPVVRGGSAEVDVDVLDVGVGGDLLVVLLAPEAAVLEAAERSATKCFEASLTYT